MKREIKFRAWDNVNKNYFKPTYEAYKGNLEDLFICLSGQLNIRTIDRIAHESLFPDRFILEQYTGSKDKNGKDIYEGDIYVMGDNNIKYQVIYRGSSFVGNQIGNKSIVGLEYWMDKIEIIGNIHENHELLKS